MIVNYKNHKIEISPITEEPGGYIDFTSPITGEIHRILIEDAADSLNKEVCKICMSEEMNLKNGNKKEVEEVKDTEKVVEEKIESMKKVEKVEIEEVDKTPVVTEESRVDIATTDFMIDIETLGVRSGSIITQIAVRGFSLECGVSTHQRLNKKIDISDSILNGMSIDQSTVDWWKAQSKEARELVFSGDKVSLSEALDELSKLVKSEDNVRVWGNGSSFDISLLEEAYRIMNKEIPWKFYRVRDLRTIVDLAELKGFNKKDIKFEGVPHNAEDDCLHQIKICCSAFKYLK